MLAVRRQATTSTVPVFKKDNIIKISFEQLSALQSIYALQILKYIEMTKDLNVWSQITEQGFGYSSLSKYSLVPWQNSTPTFATFAELKRKEFALDLQTEIDVGSTRRNVLFQIVELIWFVYHSNSDITVDFDQLAKSVIYCMIVNQDSILKEPAFRDFLRETFEMISWSRPTKDLGLSVTTNVSGSVSYAVSRLSNLFSRLALPSEISFALKQLFTKCHALKSPLLDTSQNIIESCKILLGVTTESDLLSSARWFRERGDQKFQEKLRKFGVVEYMKNCEKADSVSMANYIKKLLKTVKFGLVPECVQTIMNWLLQDPSIIPELHIECVQALLAISKERFEILKHICLVGKMILTKSKKEKITASALASVIAVGEEKVLDPTLDQYQLRADMERWQKSLGMIISNEKIFFSSQGL